MRYTRDLFENNYKATIGVDFEVEKYSIMDVPFTLQMWDTAGSERFQCIASAYYRGANSVVICFDYSKINTLNEVRKWLDQAVAENPKQEVSYNIFNPNCSTTCFILQASALNYNCLEV